MLLGETDELQMKYATKIRHLRTDLKVRARIAPVLILSFLSIFLFLDVDRILRQVTYICHNEGALFPARNVNAHSTCVEWGIPEVRAEWAEYACHIV